MLIIVNKAYFQVNANLDRIAAYVTLLRNAAKGLQHAQDPDELPDGKDLIFSLLLWWKERSTLNLPVNSMCLHLCQWEDFMISFFMVSKACLELTLS